MHDGSSEPTLQTSSSMPSTASPPWNTLQDTLVKELLQSLHLKIDNLQASTASFETKVNKIEGRLEGFEKQWSQLKLKQQRQEFCNKNHNWEKNVFKHYSAPERRLESLEKINSAAIVLNVLSISMGSANTTGNSWKNPKYR